MITDARIFICVALVTIVANRKHVLHNRFIVYALKWHRFYICCVFFSFFRSCFLFVYTIFAYRLPLVMLCLNNNSNASSRKTNKQTKPPKKTSYLSPVSVSCLSNRRCASSCGLGACFVSAGRARG